GLIDSSANVFVARYYNARVMNWMHASFGLGATLGPLLVGLVVALGFSWRAAYGLIGVLVAVLLVVLLVLRPAWPRRKKAGTSLASADDESEPFSANLLDSLRVTAVWLGMAIFFVYGGVEITAGQWSFTLFTEGRGANAEVAGLWVTAYWGVFTLGRVLVGIIADRVGALRVLDFAMLGALVGMALFWFNLSPLSSYLGLALLGFALAPIFPTLITLTPGYVGADHATNATGFQVGITGLGIAVLPWLAGVLSERISLEAIGPFLFLQGVVMTALYLWLRWRIMATPQTTSLTPAPSQEA
ncbi:MAG: MFS transporter, partial [Anaerolineales bacterium]|nr:MFS transporter [Anaerolineales bacterium]